jgi:hypothetical protein
MHKMLYLFVLLVCVSAIHAFMNHELYIHKKGSASFKLQKEKVHIVSQGKGQGSDPGP